MKNILTMLCLLIALPVNASVILQIERVSDRIGIVTATGSVSAQAFSNNHMLHFRSPFTQEPLTSPFVTTTAYSGNNEMFIGSDSVRFASTLTTADSGIPGGVIYFGSYNAGSSLQGAISGSFTLDLTAVDATFAAVGTTGDLYHGPWNGTSAVIGTYEIVASQSSSVNGPATLSMWMLGVFLVGSLKRRLRTPARLLDHD